MGLTPGWLVYVIVIIVMGITMITTIVPAVIRRARADR